MSHWAFVSTAYAVVLVATSGLLVWSYLTMRRAEVAADGLKRPE